MRIERWSGGWLLLLGALVPPAPASGQATTHLVRGQVVDLRTGLPVPGAEIFVLGQTPRTVADATGHFRRGGLAPGSYLLQVRKAGYITMTWEVAATDDSTVVHLLGVHPLLAAEVSPAAAGAIQARVVDRDSKTPVAGAEVVVLGRPQPTMTDGAGRFRHTGLAPAAYVIYVKKIGYESLSIEVVAKENTTVEHVLELRRSDIPVMDTLIVEAPPGVPGNYWLRGFEQRRAERRGQFVTRPEIEQRNAASLGDLLRTLNGLRMRCTGRGCTVQMTRTNCRPAYFADGFPADAATVERMPVNDVYGVEVYELFEVPVELQRAELRCGVIAVWTRRGPPRR